MAYQDRAMEGSTGATEAESSGWAVGLVLFAAILMVIGGVFHFIEGLAAVIDDSFYVVARGYAFNLDVTTWGWIHLITGIIVAGAGLALFSGAVWARIIAVLVAFISAIINFVYIPYYPVWSLIMLTVDAGIIWALIAHGSVLEED